MRHLPFTSSRVQTERCRISQTSARWAFPPGGSGDLSSSSESLSEPLQHLHALLCEGGWSIASAPPWRNISLDMAVNPSRGQEPAVHSAAAPDHCRLLRLWFGALQRGAAGRRPGPGSLGVIYEAAARRETARLPVFFSPPPPPHPPLSGGI